MDFIHYKNDTSGGRLARWLQPDSFVDVGKCEVIFPRTKLKCGWPTTVAVVTRDQYGDIVEVADLKVRIEKRQLSLAYVSSTFCVLILLAFFSFDASCFANVGSFEKKYSIWRRRPDRDITFFVYNSTTKPQSPLCWENFHISIPTRYFSESTIKFLKTAANDFIQTVFLRREFYQTWKNKTKRFSQPSKTPKMSSLFVNDENHVTNPFLSPITCCVLCETTSPNKLANFFLTNWNKKYVAFGGRGCTVMAFMLTLSFLTKNKSLTTSLRAKLAIVSKGLPRVTFPQRLWPKARINLKNTRIKLSHENISRLVFQNVSFYVATKLNWKCFICEKFA